MVKIDNSNGLYVCIDQAEWCDVEIGGLGGYTYIVGHFINKLWDFSIEDEH